jgi:L-ascorbate metabolism protein UlaG (beta-lactamase superfamily)
MKNSIFAGLFPFQKISYLAVLLVSLPLIAQSQTVTEFQPIRRLTNGEMVIKLVSSNASSRIEISTNLFDWHSFATFAKSNRVIEQPDSKAKFLEQRYYRARELSETNILTGEVFPTEDGDVIVRPIRHGSIVLGWKQVMLYADPVDSFRFNGIARPTLIVITHQHGDHFSADTLNSLRATNAVILAPQVVYNSLSAALKAVTTVMTNGSVTNLQGLKVEAVAMYNPIKTNHPKGVGNGYVITMGGKRFYVCGDTEDVPEMRALQDIEVAFICMNDPTMTINQAASGVRAFRPRVVYPYHYSSSNIETFKRLVGTDLGIDVRNRNWYPP